MQQATAPLQASRKAALLAGATVAVVYLLIGLLALPDHGLTWDCAVGDLAFGHQMVDRIVSGDESFLQRESWDGSDLRQPHPDLRRSFHWYTIYPVAMTLSAISCEVLWDGLGLGSALFAHHLVTILFAALLCACLTAFVARKVDLLSGLAAGIFLVASPRFFGHSINNLKDVPETCLYGLAVLAGWFALERPRRWRWWLACGAATGLALAQKANALFVPVQLGTFLILAAVLRRRRSDLGQRPTWALLRGTMAASVAFALLYLVASPQLWTDTFARMAKHFEVTLTTGNTFVPALMGKAEATMPPVSWHGPSMFFVTTPTALLLLAVIGLFTSRVTLGLRLFLALWVAIPVGRNLIPGMRSFDGVRHFMEFQAGLAALAAVGLLGARTAIVRLMTRPPRFLGAICLGVASLPLLWATASTYPNTVCYFNWTVGGLGGARDRDIGDAYDYWGNSYRQGAEWLSAHAEPGAVVLPTVAPFIFRSMARIDLRPDLRLVESTEDLENAGLLYAIYFLRPGWHDRLTWWLEDRHEPCHSITVQGAPILKVHRIQAGPEMEEVRRLLARTEEGRLAEGIVAEWLAREHEHLVPRVAEVLDALDEIGVDAAAERLRQILPPVLHPAIEPMLRRRERPGQSR